MKNGKISEAILKRSVLKQIHNSNEKVLVDSKVGNDCGIIDISHSDAIGTASSIITLDIHNMNLLARIAIFGAVNNVSAMGNKALAVTVELIIPTSWNEVKLRELMGCLDSVCAEAGVSIISGHTQVSRAVNNCVVVISAIGESALESYIKPNGLKPGMDIIATKWIGLEGTAILAMEREEELRSRYAKPFIDKAKTMADYLSIQSEAAVATKSDVCAMHDVSEGGIFAALWEMAAGSGVGLDIDLKKILVKQETIEISEFFNINPYKLVSGGCLLIGTNDGSRIIRELEKNNINASVIGVATDSNDRVIIQGEERRFLEVAQTDEIYKIMQ